MNKVVSIEIARQVFWINDDAYKTLKEYLQKLEAQLTNEEYSKEIYQDIELRIAELLFDLRCDKQKAISDNQLNEVISQIGYLDSNEDSDSETTESTKKSYLDPQNKILAGVCAGLAIRFAVPAFILRLAFLGLSLLLGLGVALYIIFWFSLDKNITRNSALAAQGKAQTAKTIANTAPPKASPLMQLQHIIFLPFSLIGALISVIGGHFRVRRRGYFKIFKVLVALTALFSTILLFGLLYQFNQNLYFYRPISWLLTASVMYFVIVIGVVYGREYYVDNSAKLKANHAIIKRKLKLGAIVPAIIIAFAIWYFNHLQSVLHSKQIDKTFAVESNQLNIQFDSNNTSDLYSEFVRFKVNAQSTNNINLLLNYSAWGVDQESAEQNIKSIDYYYSYSKDTLILDDHWVLKQGSLNRFQRVSVDISVPEDKIFSISWPLEVELNEEIRDSYLYNASIYSENYSLKENFYIASNGYIHEANEHFYDKLSNNEKYILTAKYCQEYFTGEYWSCRYNVNNEVNSNSRFDLAYLDDQANIEKLRQYLLDERSIFVSHMQEIEQIVKEITANNSVNSGLLEYIRHVINIKSKLANSK